MREQLVKQTPFYLIILFIFFAGFTQAAPAILNQVKKIPVDKKELPGYDFDTDQAFSVTSGPLKSGIIFFAMKTLGGTADVIPRFIFANNNLIIDSIELPTIQPGWNIVSVNAISAETKNDSLQVLAILTLEPLSSRENDYWNQAFVFNIDKNGKINPNTNLNISLSKKKPNINSIKELKLFLKKK